MVVDIGGTTSDVGALTHGFPREASVAVDDRRRAHQLPHAGRLLVRPRRRLARARMTRSRSGRARRLPADRAGAGLRRRHADHDRHRRRRRHGRHRRSSDASRTSTAPSSSGVMDRIQAMTEDGVDRMKTSAERVPVIIVGGGSDPDVASDRRARRRWSSRSTSRPPTRSARPSPRSPARSTASTRWTARPAPAVLDQAKRQEAADRAVAAGADPAHRPDRRRRGRAAGLPARQRHADPGQGGWRSGVLEPRHHVFVTTSD